MRRRAHIGTKRGARRALVVTGPVITSAGLILAGTFAVLAMLPIDVLLMIGFVVSVGVLVDTFIVRSMLVPAIITVVGDKSWWPSKLAKTRHARRRGGEGGAGCGVAKASPAGGSAAASARRRW